MTSLNQKPKALHLFAGKILENSHNGWTKIEARNKIETGDTIEIVPRKGPALKDKILEIMNKNGDTISTAHPNDIVTIKSAGNYHQNCLIRKPADLS